jgi:hypothetical protein
MTSEVRYEIKNFITCYLTWNFDTQKNPGWSVRNELTMTKLILVDPVEDEMLKRLVHGLILQTSYNAI